MVDQTPTELLVTAAKETIPKESRQIWIASPYHAQLARDRIRVMPDSLLSWREEDARWICELLNPLLKEEGIELLHHKSALLLACETPMHALPASFASISGKELPNRHPEGTDGGRLMRLIAEIQMVLSLKPSEKRRAAVDPDIHGLWIWSGESVAAEQPDTATLTVATRDPFLASIAGARDAEVIITDAEQLPQLVQPDAPLPKQVLMLGSDQALLLKPSIFPRFGGRGLRVGPVATEERLAEALRDFR